MTESSHQPDEAAVQFMIVDFLAEILKFSESPSEMGQYLTRQLRELMGLRAVVMLQHGPSTAEGQARIVAIEPRRVLADSLVHRLVELVDLHPDLTQAALFLGPSAPPETAFIMDRLCLASLSMTPLRVGGLRVGTLFALDHLDLQRSDDVVRLLNALSPVFALILRNTLYFESQEAKVLAQAEEYRALLQTNLDGYLVVNGDGTILDANEAYLRMTGYSHEEILALHMSDLEDSETRAETDLHTQKIKESGSDRFLSKHRRKDGTPFPVEVSTTWVANLDRGIGFIRDLTARLAAETALKASEAHHRELMEMLGEGVCMVDASETFIMANPEAERIFGVGPDDLVGRNLRTFLEDAEWEQVRDHTRRRRQGTKDAYEIVVRRVDGVHRTLQITVTPRFDGQGVFIGSLAVTRDVTDEIKTKEALRLAQKMESLGNLAGGLAHDMNNVLGAILGLSTTHLDLQPEGTQLHSTFETITKACLRGRNMVKSLLDFARKDMAGVRPVSLNSLLEGEARLLERTIPANIAILLDLDAGAGSILGDPDALSLVLMNLCVNAVDAMPEGGRLTLRTRSLLDGRILLAVEDSGTGMAPGTLEHALEPFFTTKPQGKGTGLGLSLAYSTVKAHHGELSIQSRPGRGTIIEMRFHGAKARMEPSAVAGPGAEQTAASRCILLVDDDELIQQSVLAQLEAMAHRVSFAASGEEAMVLVDQGLRPDLIILDMNMPGWGGALTLPRLRQALPAVPILLSTGRADQRAIDLAQAHDGVTILAKPFSFRELQSTFAAVLPQE
jgi:two-component system, cell cycle sensor histidine kinase and response regulator CckA